MKTNKNLILRNIYGKKILIPYRMSEAGDEPIFLNDMASEIWDLVEKGLSEEEIVGTIDREYSLTKESTEEKALIIFIDEMIKKGLIYR